MVWSGPFLCTDSDYISHDTRHYHPKLLLILSRVIAARHLPFIIQQFKKEKGQDRGGVQAKDIITLLAYSDITFSLNI
jgi:hypothetical protein